MTQSPALAARSLPGALLVPAELVERDPNQPRRDWRHDDGGTRLNELVQSIHEFGILQPLVVRRESDRYVVIAGGRRLVAAKRAGLREIPVVVRDEEGAKVRVLQLIENVQRQDLSPLDEARAYQEFIDLEGLTPPAIGLRVHVSAQHVRDRLRLLRDQVLADAVERQQITTSVAREISKLPDEEADALRRQVEDGAHLRVVDILERRTKLAEQGITNPRRKKVGPPVATETWIETSVEENVPERISPPADTRATVMVPSVSGSERVKPTPTLTSGPRRVSQHPLPIVTEMDTPVEKVTRDDRREAVVNPPREKEMAVLTLNRAETEKPAGPSLDSLVTAADWSTVESLLFYGVERGWSCAGLLQTARQILQNTGS